MQNLLAVVVAVVLTCLSVQIAQPLATSYAADAPRSGLALLENENLVQPQQQHHVRHRGAHMRTAHNGRHRQHAEVAKSESAAAEITTPALPADATESLNFARGAHKQQQHKARYGLQFDLDKHKKLQQQKHAHAHHNKYALNSRTTTATTATATATTTTDNGTATAVEELVKPTGPPTSGNARTITADEANKGSTQNYDPEAIMRQQQQQQQQQHHKHHKLQPAADVSRTKATTMTTVAHKMQATNWHVKSHRNQLVHASSHINADTVNDDAASAAAVHAHSTVGGSKQQKAAVRAVVDAAVTTENTRNDKVADYEDDDVEYYDYSADDEPHDAQPLGVADIGGYGYDSGIDGMAGDVEWRPVHVASDAKTAHHQQLRHNQEQWQAQLQLHRRQQWYGRQEQHEQQQQYESEHSRVARDHHRVQSAELHNNHLTYDTSSDDEYPDDEPDRDSREQTHEITKQKMETLGTHDAVKNEFNAYVQNQRWRQMATDHYIVMKEATKCHRPIPRVIPVSNYTFKTYYPSHTILYRCGEDTGCCRSMGQICTVKEFENVPLYFMVELVNSSNSRRHLEVLMLRNDTECHCINRAYLTSTPEFSTRDKRSDLAYRRHTRSHNAPLDAANRLEERSDLESDSGQRQEAVCRCPRHFDVFQEDISWEPTQRRHREAQANVARAYNCRCDCEDTNPSCQRFKNGDEGFAMDDRRCIAERICSIPNCSFGIYNEQIGRCPRSNRKLKRHNIGFG